MKLGFDNDLYMQKQKEHILERISRFDGKLYLEFGGKLFDDYHAARVLPGFQPDAKIRLLRSMSEHAEIVFCISADNIEKNKIRADLGISYDQDLLRQIQMVQGMGILVNSVVITRYTGQTAADLFAKKLTALGIRHYIHRPIKGYPADVDYIVSESGYGANPYIETTKPLVVVTAPGPGSGKLATCLSQVYHEQLRGKVAGYGKYETFPIWNLPLKHPVNLAYEAAAADLQDVNMIDPFHLEAYGVTTVNYNRDVEAFPIVRTILSRITGDDECYRSPTDMGVNMAGNCIVDDDACCNASRMEILRRYYTACAKRLRGMGDDTEVHKLELLMKQAKVSAELFPAVSTALLKAETTGAPAGAMVLPDGRVVTGRTSDTLGAASALLLNALKTLAGIEDRLHLISAQVLEPICDLKTQYLKHKNPRLHTDEVLMALTISALSDPIAMQAKEQLANLKGSDAHFTVILSEEDEMLLRRLGINVSCEPQYETKRLYHK